MILDRILDLLAALALVALLLVPATSRFFVWGL